MSCQVTRHPVYENFQCPPQCGESERGCSCTMSCQSPGGIPRTQRVCVRMCVCVHEGGPLASGWLHVPVSAGDAPARTPPAWGSPRPLDQATALLVKRLRHTRRAWKGALSDLLLPVLFVALAMALFMVRPLAIDYPPLKLTPGHYNRAEASFFR